MSEPTDDAFFKDTTGTVLLTNDQAKEVLNKIKPSVKNMGYIL